MVSSYEELLNTSKRNVFLDSETCGLHSMMVLFQYAVDDGPIELYEVWKEPVWKTLELFEALTKHVVIGFNLTFDWFHVVKIWTIWDLLPRDWIPEEHIEEIAQIEPKGQDGKCLKPHSALDLMLHSRKGPYQSLMARKDIRIKRIPLTPVEWNGQVIPMAYAVANYLEQTVKMDGIYFARKKFERSDGQYEGYWTVEDREDKDGNRDKQFADVVLKFSPDGSLKSLAEHALKIPPKYKFADVELDTKHRPIEYGFAPTALAVSTSEKNWEVWGPNDKGEMKLQGYAWPGVIQLHIDHWHENEAAREYANDDIVYTRGLYQHFDCPEHGDNDSLLSCMVPSVRWHGFSVDIAGIEQLLEQAREVVLKAPINTNKPPEVRAYINEMMDDTECAFLEETTKKSKLEEISQWIIEEEEMCLKCLGSGCTRCDGGMIPVGKHPAANRAKEILDVKIAKKEIELYQKILLAGKFHASFKITGTLSNRMSGGDGLNAQGIKHDPFVRSKFPLAWEGYKLCGGDFDSFEVTLADAVYNDVDLRKALLEGKKLHGLFGTLLFPGYTYEEILDSDKNSEKYPHGNMYSKGKAGVFAMVYGGNAATLNRNIGIPMETAEKAYAGWGQMFPGIAVARERVSNSFQPLQQPGGIGSAIHWNEPDEYVESFIGFRRYFTLEFMIVRALFDLARNLPKEWRQANEIVVRSEHKGPQKAWGALASALYGAAFAIAEGIVRAAANHEIQSPGADITKDTQCAVWSVQPEGANEFRVAAMNIHDELMCVTHPDYVETVADVVETTVESYREKVPLIGMSWCLEMANWAEKSGGDDAPMRKVTYDREAMLAQC